jgi:hypothetical protein
MGHKQTKLNKKPMFIILPPIGINHTNGGLVCLNLEFK